MNDKPAITLEELAERTSQHCGIERETTKKVLEACSAVLLEDLKRHQVAFFLAAGHSRVLHLRPGPPADPRL